MNTQLGDVDPCPCSLIDWLCGLGQVSVPLWTALYHLSQGVGVETRSSLCRFLGLGSLGLRGMSWTSLEPCLFPHRGSSRAGCRGTSLPVADLSSSLMRWTRCPLA